MREKLNKTTQVLITVTVIFVCDETAIKLVTHHDNWRRWKWFLFHFLDDAKIMILRKLLFTEFFPITSSERLSGHPKLARYFGHFAKQFSRCSRSFQQFRSRLVRLLIPGSFRLLSFHFWWQQALQALLQTKVPWFGFESWFWRH